MTSHGLGACGGGGWTLVMKIDGSKVSCGTLFKTLYGRPYSEICRRLIKTRNS